MLNKDGQRELAYIVEVKNITPMNADRLECAHIGGWHCVVGKGEFKVGDLAVYFEVDSKLPEVAPFNEMEFLKSKHYKVKTQKIRGEYSQGLLVPVSAFGWEAYPAANIDEPCVKDEEGKYHYLGTEEIFLTKKLGVTYAVSEDNQRKASSGDKYKAMAQRKPNLFKKSWARWMMKREWGRKVMFLFFGKKKDKNGWPAWVKKTDEERVQNLDYNALKSEEWIVTEKIDGTSTTFTLKKGSFGRQFYVCSRNVAFLKPEQQCYYDSNVYLEMAEKYNMKKLMNDMLNSMPSKVCYITLQGETYGAGIQNRGYGMKDHDIRVFNVILGFKDGKSVRMNPIDGAQFMKVYGVPYVPVIELNFKLPNTCEELLEYADGKSVIDGGPREGCVFRSKDGERSFKAVSNKYLLKYHG